jgi:hypothetical protein
MASNRLEDRGTRETEGRSPVGYRRGAVVTIRRIPIAALAIALIGGLGGCAAAPAPGCPAAAAMLVPPKNPPPAANLAPPSVPAAPVAPADATQPEPMPNRAIPPAAERDQTAPRRVTLDQFSGSSMPPPAGPAASRRGKDRQTVARHRHQDLDEAQIEAQWINPPVGAGE